jgi:hypothetical protein
VVRYHDPGFTTVGSSLDEFEFTMVMGKEVIYPAVSCMTNSFLNVSTYPMREDGIRLM